MKDLNKLSNIPENSLVFVDSNIFLYFILGDPLHHESCKNFLGRTENGELIGVINSTVISETYFTYMRIQIKETFDIALREVLTLLKENPDAIKTIDMEPVDMVFNIPHIYVVNIRRETLDSFGDSITKYGLLPNDTLHVLTCYGNEIKNIATNDLDFERVGFLRIWRP